MSIEIVKTFLQNMSDTATVTKLDVHLDLISKDVQLFGFPGFDVTGFSNWTAQCKREFSEGFIKDVSYEGLKIITSNEKCIMFKTIEAADGKKRDGDRSRSGEGRRWSMAYHSGTHFT